MNYLPFDLEIALKHPERIITRDGKLKVKALYLVPDWLVNGYQLKVIFENGVIYSFTKEGQYFSHTKGSSVDLFLLPESIPYKEWWVNVYTWKSNGELCLFTNNTEEEAKKSIADEGNLFTYIKTIKITNE